MKWNDVVDKWYSEIVKGMMDHDLSVAIENKANFLAALGLMVYTEAIGGVVTGYLGVDGRSRQNFEAALPWLGPSYVQTDALLKRQSKTGRDGLYKLVRCGLVHEYFIKGAATIWRHTEEPRPPCAILIEQNGRIHLIADMYREDLMAAATRIRDGLVPPNLIPALVNAFGKSMKLRPANPKTP